MVEAIRTCICLTEETKFKRILRWTTEFGFEVQVWLGESERVTSHDQVCEDHIDRLASTDALCNLCQPTPDMPDPPYLLVPSFVSLRNSMFNLGYIPPQLDISLITPVFKKGDPNDVSLGSNGQQWYRWDCGMVRAGQARALVLRQHCH